MSVEKLIHTDFAAWYATRRERGFIRKGMFINTQQSRLFAHVMGYWT